MKENQRISMLDKLCSLIEINERKIRFYIQNGLLVCPEGSGKGAHYTYRYIQQLLTIHKRKNPWISFE